MITRRNFLKAGAAVAALSVVPNGFASVLAKKDKAIGLQLYSVRDDLGKDFDNTMKAVVKIGYKRLEAAGYNDGKFYGKTPAEMKKYLYRPARCHEDPSTVLLAHYIGYLKIQIHVLILGFSSN